MLEIVEGGGKESKAGKGALGVKVKPACGLHGSDCTFQPEIREFESWQRAQYPWKLVRSFCHH